jgi:Na+-translocating ferredoxin:NAD+ oxidoreductase RnfC subunit
VSPTGCPGCACVGNAPAHALVAALARDDLDRALDLGLLDTTGCPTCSAACTATLVGYRDERRAALAARERFRARQARLARRAAEKAARMPSSATERSIAAARPALPAAAADVLARALARAKAPRP